MGGLEGLLRYGDGAALTQGEAGPVRGHGQPLPDSVCVPVLHEPTALWSCSLVPVLPGPWSLTGMQSKREAKPSLRVADTRPWRALPVSRSSVMSSIPQGWCSDFSVCANVLGHTC